MAHMKVFLLQFLLVRDNRQQQYLSVNLLLSRAEHLPQSVRYTRQSSCVKKQVTVMMYRKCTQNLQFWQVRLLLKITSTQPLTEMSTKNLPEG
jgi:hypothetical protein